MIILIALLVIAGLYTLYHWWKVFDNRKTKMLDKIAETDPLAANRIATLNCKVPISK